jgi:YidC/Oxa1 family membrane protein insertase
MNDRTRTILALFLIFGVFIAFQFLGPKPQHPKAHQDSDTAASPAPSATVPLPATVPAAKAASAKTVPAPAEVETRELSLESDGLEVKLSSLGAALTQCRLGKYRGPDGKPVQLIPEGGSALGLEVQFQGQALDLSKHPFSVAEAGPERVVFEAPTEHFLVRKTYAALEGGLGLSLIVEISARPGGAGLGPRYKLSWGCGLNSTEKDRKLDLNEFGALAMLGKDLATDKLKKLAKPDLEEIEGNIAYSGVRTKYFLAAMVPPAGRAVSVKQGLAGPEKATSTLSMAVQGSVSDSFKVYLGPIEHRRLARVNPGLDRVADTGWRWLQWISRGILSILTAINRAVPNWGLVIVIFSALMKVLFFPLTYSGTKSMKRMQMLQPKLKKIQEKHKGDQARISQETMALYKEHGANPLSGCLPLLIQMPIFFALYQVLVNTIELRQAPFMLWLADLSVKDPYYVLPVLMGIAMFIQQKMTTVDPKQKMMVYIMPVFMAVIFMNMPAGLNLYWLTNNILSIGEQYLIHVRTQPIPQD